MVARKWLVNSRANCPRKKVEPVMEYKKFLIENILAWQKNGQFTAEDLAKMSIRALEIIHDNV